MSYFLDKSAVEVVQNIAQKAAQPNKSLLATIIGIAAREGRLSPASEKFWQCAIQTASISKIVRVKA